MFCSKIHKEIKFILARKIRYVPGQFELKYYYSVNMFFWTYEIYVFLLQYSNWPAHWFQTCKNDLKILGFHFNSKQKKIC